MACIRRSSFCCLSVSFGCFPRNFPLARAMAIPSRVRIRIRSGKSVQLWYNKCIALPDSSDRLIQTWTLPVCAGQAMICVDTIRRDTKIGERRFLYSQILFVSRVTCISDKGVCHKECVRLRSLHCKSNRTIHKRQALFKFPDVLLPAQNRPLNDLHTDTR